MEIVCSDVIGPFLQNDRTKQQYVVIFIDDCLNFATVYVIRSKSEVAESFLDYVKKCESQFIDQPICLFRCDNAREFVTGDIAKIYEERGITIDATNPYCPE